MILLVKNGGHLSIYAGEGASGRGTGEAGEGITGGAGKSWINNK